MLPAHQFEALREQLFSTPFECRVHQQGDALTRRVPFGPAERRQFPALADLISSDLWRRLVSYVASSRAAPLYYFQTILGGALDGPPDPQIALHADTFHPSLKAFYFLTDVGEADRPLTYVAGSHRLTPARIAWERRRSVEVLQDGDRLSQRGSLRISREELAELGLPEPTRFCVPANTLIVVDTCGFHARAAGTGRSVRAELWAYGRSNPFLPWTGLGLWSLIPAAADRRAAWLYGLLDRLDRWGWRKQHWRAGEARRLNQI
jgi:hypothetical protein